jgi:hypothetical protein
MPFVTVYLLTARAAHRQKAPIGLERHRARIDIIAVDVIQVPRFGLRRRYCDEAASEACCERLGCAVNVNPVEEPPRLQRVLCLEPQAGGLTMITAPNVSKKMGAEMESSGDPWAAPDQQ